MFDLTWIWELSWSQFLNLLINFLIVCVLGTRLFISYGAGWLRWKLYPPQDYRVHTGVPKNDAS